MLIADLIGIHPVTAERWSALAAERWSEYVTNRVDGHART